MARRPWGSIERRGNSLRIEYPGPDGKAFRESLPKGSTIKEAQTLLDRRKRELQTGSWVEPSTMTVGDLLDVWLQSRPQTPAAMSTNRHYRQRAGRILAIAGSWRLQSVNKLAQAEAVRTALEQQGLSPKTVKDTLDTARVAFNYAIHHGWLAVNVFAWVERPKIERPNKKALPAEQARRLFEACRAARDQRYDDWAPCGYMLGFALLTLRRVESELAALRWSDIGEGTITINQAWDDRHRMMKPAGGTKVKRKMYRLSVQANELLELQRKAIQRMRWRANRNGFAWEENDLVFPSRYGQPMPRTNIAKAVKRLCEAAGVPSITPHELRHTGASLLISMGVTKFQLLAMGGWSTLTVVEQTYGHLFPEDQAAAAKALGELLTSRQGSR